MQVSHLAVTEAAATNRLDVQLVALNNQLASEWHRARGYPQRTLREIEQLDQTWALGPRSMWVAWAHGFFAVWNDSTAEKWV